jgi:uncharacterized protein YdeI (YjbR/CyaY-like superfamily)
MPTLDPRVDAYIARSAEFARPILERLRALVHRGCPEVVETMKWSAPAFDHQGPLAMMAAFKPHCTFGFWKHSLLAPSDQRMEAMGQFGRITSLADLPPERALVDAVKQAAALNASGAKVPRPKKHPQPEIPVPAELAAGLAKKKNARAKATFEGFPPSHRREYLEWIVEAKGADTRARRIAQTIAWLHEGKSRNWKYEAKPAAAKPKAKPVAARPAKARKR